MKKPTKEEGSIVYPIVTRIKERRNIVINGKNETVDETVEMDYGPKGKTVGHILAIDNDPEKARKNREELNRFLGTLGYQLKEKSSD